MTNKLTERYRKGTLPSGSYYFKNRFGHTYAVDYHNVGTKGLNGVEVLSEVPCFDEYEKLKKRLAIAIKALKLYQTEEPPINCPKEDEKGSYYPYRYNYVVAKEALKQIKELEK